MQKCVISVVELNGAISETHYNTQNLGQIKNKLLLLHVNSITSVKSTPLIEGRTLIKSSE